jgi:hypothetical protein
MEKVQPDPLIHRELSLPMFAIIEGFVPLLSLFKAFTDLHQELITVCQLLLCHWQASFTNCICVHRRQLVTRPL